MMQKQNLIVRGIYSGICLAVLAGCAGTDWATISDVRQIAAMREEISKPNLSFNDVLIIRMKTETGNRVDITSIGPSVVSAQKGGAPAARTTFALTSKRDILVLFTQDVPHWKAFRKEIPVAQLTPGMAFRFPVVQESGEVKTQTFTIEKIITQ